MADDGFHEIQLGKKQLVFSFMAAAVALVVTFLFGVWVGRDVRRQDSEIVPDAPVTAEVTSDTPQPPTQVAANELDYTARLQSGGAKPDAKSTEQVKPTEPPTPAADVPTTDQPPTPAPAPKTAAKEPAPKETTPATKPAPATGTWHLQAAAFKEKKPADTLAAQLVKKGYTAYVVTTATGVYRFKVAVGPFADRAAAEASSAKLKKEERLSPLVQR